MSVLRRLIILTFPLMIAACSAEEVKTEPNVEVKIQSDAQLANVKFDESKLKARFEKMGVRVNNIAPASLDGLVEIDTTGGLFFSNLVGDQFIAGALYSLDEDGQYVNIIEERKAPLNAEKIAGFEDQMIVYPAENEKYAITVFTDTTCGYCVKLHHQMSEYTN